MLLPTVAEGLVPALLTRVDRSAYDVLTPDGPARVDAVPAPRDPLDAPTVGDHLVLSQDLTVLEVLPRRSLLVRGTARGTSVGQPLAANVDHVLLCLGLSGPLPLRRLERLLTLAWESGATPVVVLTKAVLLVGAGAAGSLRGRESTVVNALLGSPVMATGDTREVDGKGRHTTTHRELLVLPTGGVVIDTPGLRGVGLHAADDGLSLAFSDVEDLASACRFADCRHVSEPGCAVLASVEAGDLGQDRVDSWRKLQRELAFQARRTDARLQAEESRRWRTISKAQRARGGRP